MLNRITKLVVVAQLLLGAVTVSYADRPFFGLLEKANGGDVEAMCAVAECYRFGIGIARSPDKCEEWTQKAASNGCLRALGLCNECGWGMPENGSEAFKCFRKAVENGDVLALARLGKCYEYGTGVKKDAGEAVRQYRKGAEAGDARAMCNLAQCYKVGEGVPKDEVKCSKWYRKAADGGDALGMFYLGVNYASGCGVEQSTQEHERWLRRSAEEGFSFAMFCLGEEYEHGAFPCENEEDSFKWYLRAGELDVISAMNCLGVCYYGGIGVERDVAKALKWFQKACEHGDAQSRKNLAWLFSHEDSLTDAERASMRGCLQVGVQENNDSRMFSDLHDLRLGWRYRPARSCAKIFIRMIRGKELDDVPKHRLLVAGAAYKVYTILAQRREGRVAVFLIFWTACVVIGCQLIWRGLRKRKRSVRMTYHVIYRESVDSVPKSAEMTSMGEDKLRNSCEMNGWDVLKIRCLGEARWAASFSRLLVRELRSPIRLGVSTREICSFCEDMNTLLAAGVAVPHAVAFCVRECRNRWFGKRLAVVQQRLCDGDGLANAMSDPRCAAAFPPLMRRAVRVGEANGNLDVAFARLAVVHRLNPDKRRAKNFFPSLVGCIFSLLVIVVIAVKVTAFTLAEGLLFLFVILAGCGIGWIAGLWLRQRLRPNIAVKIALTNFSRKTRRCSVWIDEKGSVGCVPLVLLILTLIALPFFIEVLGEALDWYHFPATAWVKGFFR